MLVEEIARRLDKFDGYDRHIHETVMPDLLNVAAHVKVFLEKQAEYKKNRRSHIHFVQYDQAIRKLKSAFKQLESNNV